MKKLLLVILITLNCYPIFEAWTEFNRRNRETIKMMFNGMPLPSNRNKDNGNCQNNNDSNDEQAQSSNKSILFKDIIGGVPEEIIDLEKMLNNDEAFKAVGAEKPTGILLVGPPGTGKTMLAKAMAGQMNAAFIESSAASFMEIYVGTGPKKVKELFQQANDALHYHKKAIIFIDEMDAIGKRNSNMGGGAGEENRTINELLVQMDGFKKNNNIIVMAATNRIECLDEALLRPGRFDWIINIGLPDTGKRLALLKHYLFKNGRKVDKKINVQDFAQKTDGFNCAEIKDFINQAALNAARNNDKSLQEKHLETAYQKVKNTKNMYR